MASTKLDAEDIKVNGSGSLHSGSSQPEGKQTSTPRVTADSAAESRCPRHRGAPGSQDLTGQRSRVQLLGRNATGLNPKHQAGGSQAKAMREGNMAIL